MLDLSEQTNTLEESTPARLRVALLVEYCGWDFFGSQFQPGHPTVQSALQNGLKRLNLKTSAVTFASRTDSKVNSMGQVAHFDIEPNALQNIPELAAALNAVLPNTVSVRATQLDASLDFHSRREAEYKWYRYRIYNAPTRSVWASREPSTHYKPLLDVSTMDHAAQLIQGRHDFKSFKDSDTHVIDNVCDIVYAKVVRDSDYVNFDIVANRFLYKMVRNIAGQLMAIGHAERQLPPETILQILAEQDRTKAAATAYPEGLTLMAIKYKSPFNYFAQDRLVQKLETIITQTRMESLQDENLFRKAS